MQRCWQPRPLQLTFLAAALVLGTVLLSEEDEGSFPKAIDTQLDPPPLTTPAEALAAIRTPEGFQVTLFAAEPEVRQPIGFTTDPRGRLWVAENYT